MCVSTINLVSFTCFIVTDELLISYTRYSRTDKISGSVNIIIINNFLTYSLRYFLASIVSTEIKRKVMVKVKNTTEVINP